MLVLAIINVIFLFLKMSKSFVSELVCSIRKAGIPRLLIPQFIIEHNSRFRKSSSMMVVTDWPIFLQVNLTKCTKEVDADLQALCPQNVETNEKPLAVYLKNLCCDTCNFQESGKVNRLAIYLGSILGALLVIVLVSIIAVLAYKNRAIRASLREIQEGNTTTTTTTTT